MSDSEGLLYTLRPDRTALWLPLWLAESLEIKKGEMLTEAQFNGFGVQQLLQDRQRAQVEREKGVRR